MQAKFQAAAPLVSYLCNRQKCKNCSSVIDGLCRHTSDIKYAKYKTGPRDFEQQGMFLFEKERNL